jgi:hypothetical protein
MLLLFLNANYSKNMSTDFAKKDREAEQTVLYRYPENTESSGME